VTRLVCLPLHQQIRKGVDASLVAMADDNPNITTATTAISNATAAATTGSAGDAPAPAGILERSFMYFDSANVQRGPAPAATLRALFLGKQVSLATYVWTDPMPDWQPIEAVPELKSFVETGSVVSSSNAQAFGVPSAASVQSSGNAEGSSDAFTTASTYLDLEQQMPSYTTNSETNAEASTRKRKRQSKNKRKRPNSWVYATGLPPDSTVSEVAAFFSKCGVLQTDAETGLPRVKLYKHSDGVSLKGDCSVAYVKKESVELAVQILHEAFLREDWPISVQPATFELKPGSSADGKSSSSAGESGNEGGGKRPQVDEKLVRLRKLQASQALSWNEEVRTCVCALRLFYQ
jgi:hypothetical protein